MSAKKDIGSNIDSFGKHYSKHNMSHEKIIAPIIDFASKFYKWISKVFCWMTKKKYAWYSLVDESNRE